jgi:hypothetical protein
VSVEAVVALSLICAVIVAAIGHDRGHRLFQVLDLLTRLDGMLVVALIRLWRSS